MALSAPMDFFLCTVPCKHVCITLTGNVPSVLSLFRDIPLALQKISIWFLQKYKLSNSLKIRTVSSAYAVYSYIYIIQDFIISVRRMQKLHIYLHIFVVIKITVFLSASLLI